MGALAFAVAVGSSYGQIAAFAEEGDASAVSQETLDAMARD